ncbi:putative sugar nucleotidyl transferase [Mucilaginibacter segetis]|uniref:Glucose-1-phosphate thymidylyltransferase n=1 Tax=Mucilaginibacter segetis TaxID=2793071 RepID=A0A934PRN6_9SPHI|nr:putative sugar nucleotidyl transferase [Mucilaginibacter segetis]MBK0379534.1 glucose-1-phosphate thymidylyltransferase [Mucilaginibacter segetis]
MAIILFDDNARNTLLPLTFTRPVADMRIGILTIAEKWGKHLGLGFSYFTTAHLQQKFALHINDDNLFINGAVCPDDGLLEAINKLQEGEALKRDKKLIAVKLNSANAKSFDIDALLKSAIGYQSDFISIQFPEDIFKNNDAELCKDFALLTKGRTSVSISNTNVIIGDNFFAEDGAEAECATFNTMMGPVYLGKNSSVWEGSNIRGSFALGEHSQVKMGAKIYSATTIGPYCRVGGEINNAVIWGYSSKGHEGYLGNSVMGEWCNIGADSNNSNLKNNYADVRLWDYPSRNYRETGLQFCGLIMADHAKCGINTMFNTGTVVGVGANVFGAGFPPNFFPDFSWGGAQSMQEHKFNKFLETTERVISRRDHRKFDEVEKRILETVFELTAAYRK